MTQGEVPRMRPGPTWGLRLRIALGVALPVLIAMATLSLVHYWRARRLIENQARASAVQTGIVITHSLRNAMLRNDSTHLREALADVGQSGTIERVQILDAKGVVKVDSAELDVGLLRSQQEAGCVVCHQIPPATRPRTAMLGSASGILRIAAPIANEPECASCHAGEGPHLGILLADVPLLDLQRPLITQLQIDLLISAGLALLVTLGVYWLIHRVVVRRVEAFRGPLSAFATGDFSSRLPPTSRIADEVEELAASFNRMAERLESHAQEQEELHRLRNRAIADERERIARELHDGFAQLLGYVNTKAMAVRLMLKRHKVREAERHLEQLEQAARDLYTSVREAILGLRVGGASEKGLAAMLTRYTEQFEMLSGLPTHFSAVGAPQALRLGVESELQVLRIVQEALSNVRKHATAHRASVELRLSDGVLEVQVSDDGQGFDPRQGSEQGEALRFGISTMRERAASIGADLTITSLPGHGTRLSIRVPLKES
jgi:signal transduction histidine kinase